MARLPYLEPEDLAPEDRDLLARGIALHKLMVHSPKAARAFGVLANFIRHESALDPRLRELAILQVGYMTGSRYEYSHHIKVGREFGVTDADIAALDQENQGQTNSLEPLARTVLRAAREMTENLEMAESTFSELQRELGNECLIDLIVTISFYNAVVRFLASTKVDVEEDYLPYLDEFPLPGTN